MRHKPTQVLYSLVALALFLVLTACNAPPLYESRAQKYLERHGVSNDLILRLVERRPLSESEAAMLEQHDDTAVLHLLASNPVIPASMITRLAANRDEEVRWGIAYNPNATVDTLLPLRTTGSYSTMNEYLARNPRLSLEVLREMYRNHEASKVNFAMNPNCPPELMHDIEANGNDLDKTWLAANTSLPPDLIAKLAADPSENVQRFLLRNPSYQAWLANNGAPKNVPAQGGTR